MTNKLTAKGGFVGKVAVWLLLTLGAVLLALVVMGQKPQPAEAVESCGQSEEGAWVNTGQVDFVEAIALVCEKSYQNGKPKHTWAVEVWVRESRAYGYSCPLGQYSCIVHWFPKMAEGYTESGKIYVLYKHYYLWTDTLYAKMSENSPGKLWVGVHRVGRGDQQGGEADTDDWLTKKQL